MELCSVNFIIPIGSAHDPDELVGITHIIEHLFFHAHPYLSQEELMLKIEEMGGIFNAVTDREMTVIYGRIHKKYVNEVIRLFSEVLQNLSISLSHFDSEKQIIQRELSIPLKKSFSRIHIMHHEKLFKNHPYGRNQYIKNDVEKISKKDILSFLSHYQWEAWNILIVGCIKENNIKFEQNRIIRKTNIPQIPSCPDLRKNMIYTHEGLMNGIIVSIPIPTSISDLESIIVLYGLYKGISTPFYTKVIKEKGIAYNIESSIRIFESFRLLEFGWVCQNKDVDLSKEICLSLLSDLTLDSMNIDKYLKSGIEKARTEITLIHENFLGYSSHLIKKLALESFENEIFNETFLQNINMTKLVKSIFSQTKAIGIYKKIERR